MFGGPDSDVLMEVSVPVWSQKDCQSAYVERIGDTMVCAGAKEGGRDSCQVTCFNYYLRSIHEPYNLFAIFCDFLLLSA